MLIGLNQSGSIVEELAKGKLLPIFNMCTIALLSVDKYFNLSMYFMKQP